MVWACSHLFFLTFLTHCSPLFVAQKPQTDQAGTSRDHTISLENGCGSITVRQAGEPSISIGNRGHIYAHTHRYIYNIIYIIYHTPNREKFETWKYDVSPTHVHTILETRLHLVLYCDLLLSSLRRRWRDDMCNGVNGNVHQHL